MTLISFLEFLPTQYLIAYLHDLAYEERGGVESRDLFLLYHVILLHRPASGRPRP